MTVKKSGPCAYCASIGETHNCFGEPHRPVGVPIKNYDSAERAKLAEQLSHLAPERARHLNPITAADAGSTFVAVAQNYATRRLVATRASDITVKPVHWLWAERIPLGALTLLAGREGIGKSLAGYTLAADITRGRLAGRMFRSPSSVLIVATEDSWAQTIVPRLMAADADLTRIHRVTATTGTGDAGVSLPVDLGDLEQLVKTTGATLVLLDPLMSRLDSGLDSHKDSEVRQALEPLVALADRTNVALLGIIHVNKSTSSDPLTTIMASRAFAAVARAVLFVAKDPDDPAVRLVGQEKNNLGRLDLPTLTFTVEGTIVAQTDDGPVGTGKLVWTGETERTIRDVITTVMETAETRTAKQEAADWLTDYLFTQGGTAASADIKAEGRKAGHSEAALKRAADLLKLLKTSSGFPRVTTWSNPAQSAHPQSAHPGESDLTELTALTGETDMQSVQSDQLDQLSQTPRDVSQPQTTSDVDVNPDISTIAEPFPVEIEELPPAYWLDLHRQGAS